MHSYAEPEFTIDAAFGVRRELRQMHSYADPEFTFQ